MSCKEDDARDKRSDFLEGVSQSLFGFVIALCLTNLEGVGIFQVTKLNVTLGPFFVAIFLMGVFSLPFFFYWYSRRCFTLRYMNSFWRFLGVGLLISIISVLPYLGYLITYLHFIH